MVHWHLTCTFIQSGSLYPPIPPYTCISYNIFDLYIGNVCFVNIFKNIYCLFQQLVFKYILIYFIFVCVNVLKSQKPLWFHPQQECAEQQNSALFCYVYCTLWSFFENKFLLSFSLNKSLKTYKNLCSYRKYNCLFKVSAQGKKKISIRWKTFIVTIW